MSADLHTRLLAAVQQRMDVAGSATSGPWNNDDPMSSDGVYAPAVDGYVADCGYERMGPFAVANATHIAANDPATVLRHCERDLKVLERHGQIEQRNWSAQRGTFTEPACVHCELTSNDGDPLYRDWPCDEVLDLAAAYGVDVDGG